MITHDVEQGSPEWFAVRRGIPTASEFDKIITASGDRSKQSSDYMDRLIAEYISGESCATFKGTRDTERGKELEAEAIEAYEMTFGTTVQRVGFVTNDGKTIGCSPDGLVGEDGGIELKCPAGGTLVYYMRSGKLADEYRVQIQGNLLVTGRKWWDAWGYHPKMKRVHIRCPRDDLFILKLSTLLGEFNASMNQRISDLRAKGYLDEVEAL